MLWRDISILGSDPSRLLPTKTRTRLQEAQKQSCLAYANVLVRGSVSFCMNYSIFSIRYHHGLPILAAVVSCYRSTRRTDLYGPNLFKE